MSDEQHISVYDRTAIMMEGLIPVVRVLQKELGEERANALVAEALKPMGRQYGEIINAMKGDNGIERMAEAFPVFGEGDALDYDVLRQEQGVFDVDVTRCRYSQFMEDLGAKDLGPLLMCGLDYDMADVLGLELDRQTTIMKGGKCCSFRYRAKE